MPCKVGALGLDHPVVHAKSLLYCPLTEGGVVAAAGAGAGGSGGPVPPHGPPGALPQHHGQGDHRDAGMGFNTVVIEITITNQLLCCRRSVLICNKLWTLNLSGNQIVNQLQQF